jgi:uncharacterized membrane protein
MDQSAATTGEDSGAERAIGRLLIAMTYVAVVLLLIGFVLASTPILSLGIVVVIATPITRVVGAAISFGSTGQWVMVGISAGILAIIAFGTAAAIAATV